MDEVFKKYLQENIHLDNKIYEELLPFIQFKKIEKGEYLLKQGDTCQHAFFVEKGLLRSYNIDDAGKEHIIQFAPEEWFINDRVSVCFKEPTGLFIDALEETNVVKISTDFFERMNSIHPGFTKWNETLLQRHIYYLQKRISLLIGAKAEERYLNFIELYPQLMLRVPQWMIASYLGITPESLSRVRKEMANKNFSSGIRK